MLNRSFVAGCSQCSMQYYETDECLTQAQVRARRIAELRQQVADSRRNLPR